MSGLVVDASVVAGWVLSDESNRYTERVAAAIESGLEPWAPHLLLWETSNLLLTAE